MIELNNIYKTYKVKNGPTVKALNNVSCKLNDTGLVFMLGKSGSGKSTMLNIIGGLDTPDSGEIIVNGTSFVDFNQAKYDSYRNSLIGFIFQEYNVINEFNVGDNIGLALRLQNKKCDEEEINKILKKVDLEGLAKRKMNELSGGQKQRVAIARALVKDPEIILADEPTGALDSNTGKQVFKILKELSKDHLILVVSHDREFAEYYGDRVIELADGEIISDITKVKDSIDDGASSDNLKVFNNSLLSIQPGVDLTAKEVDVFKNFVKNSKHEIFITSNEKGIQALKQTLNINDKNESSSYKNTTDELIEQTSNPEHKNKDFVYHKNHLPWKESMRVAFSSLKAKPWQLVFTFLLTIASFSCFGFAESLVSFNKKDVFLKNAKSGEYISNVYNVGDYDPSFYRNSEDDVRILEILSQPYENRDWDKLYDLKKEDYLYKHLITNKGVNKIDNKYGLKLDKVYSSNVIYATNGIYSQVYSTRDYEDSYRYDAIDITANQNSSYNVNTLNDIEAVRLLKDEYSTYKTGLKDEISFYPLDIYNLEYSKMHSFEKTVREDGIKSNNCYRDIYKTLLEEPNTSESRRKIREANQEIQLSYRTIKNELYDSVDDHLDSKYEVESWKYFVSGAYDKAKPLKSVVLFPTYTEHNNRARSEHNKFFNIDSLTKQPKLVHGRLPNKGSNEICITDYMFETMKLYGANQYLDAKGNTYLNNIDLNMNKRGADSLYVEEGSNPYLENSKTLYFDNWNDFSSKKINYQYMKKTLTKTINRSPYMTSIETNLENEGYIQTNKYDYEIINCPIVGIVDTGFNLNKFKTISNMDNLKPGVKGHVRAENLERMSAQDLTPFYNGIDSLKKTAPYTFEFEELSFLRDHYGLGIYGRDDFLKNVSKLDDTDLVNTKNLKVEAINALNYYDEGYKICYINYANQPDYNKLFELFDSKLTKGKGYQEGLFIKINDRANPNDTSNYYVLDALYARVSTMEKELNFVSDILFWTAFGIGAFSVILLAFFINNSIIYKRREIGILRSIGASGMDIYGIFLNESLIITTISGIIAIIISSVGVHFLSSYLGYVAGFRPFYFGIIPILVLIAIMVGDALLASFIPCYAISRQKPIDSIRLK